MKFNTKITLIILSLIVISCGGAPGSSSSTLATSVNFSENFSGTNGDAWPSGWSITSGAATLAVDIQNNRGHLSSNSYDGLNSNTALTRVYNSSVNLQSADVVFTVRFENFSSQGVGFYLRQNGGYLTDSVTNGQGYGVFLEGNSNDFGLWYELNGVEIKITGVYNPPITILDDTEYQIRYQVEQININDTIQRAKIWLITNSEPASWNIETTTSIANLQNISGGIAVDLFNYSGTDSVYLDDISVSRIN